MQIIVASVVIGVVLLVLIMTLSRTLTRPKEIVIIDEEILTFQQESSSSLDAVDALPIAKGEASLPPPSLVLPKADVTAAFCGVDGTAGLEEAIVVNAESSSSSAEQTSGQL